MKRPFRGTLFQIIFNKKNLRPKEVLLENISVFEIISTAEEMRLANGLKVDGESSISKLALFFF
jgi:hypothetical protein